jgi:hypothetical protein
MPSFYRLLTLVFIVSSATPARGAAVSYFQECAFLTGRTATVVISEDTPLLTEGEPIQKGDEIAVFTADGLCAGAAVWTGVSMALAVWEDDPMTTDINGFRAGDNLEYRVYRAATGVEYTTTALAIVEYDPVFRTDGLFEADAIYLLGRLELAEQAAIEVEPELSFDLGGAFPNPFWSQTTLAYSVPTETEVRLEVFDVLGRRVSTLVDEIQAPGWYEARFQAEPGLASGLYIARLRAGGQSLVSRFTLAR